MPKTAIIFAEAAEARRAIAQLIKPSELFAEVCFSSTGKEVAALLKKQQIDILLCDLPPGRQPSLQLVEQLVRLTAELTTAVPIVYCSPLRTEELRQQGMIPVGSHCLNYHSSSLTVSKRLKQLLQKKSPQQPQKTALENLLDKSSGVYNRFYFDSFLDHEISRSKLTGRPFSLLLIEPQPEPAEVSWARLLPAIASTIQEQIRASDLLCRVDQNRFALLLPETAGHLAEQVVFRIRNRLQETTNEKNLRFNFGMASSGQSDNFNRQGLLRAAEEGL